MFSPRIVDWSMALTAGVLLTVVYRSRREPMRTRIPPGLAHVLTRTGAFLGLVGAVLAGWAVLNPGRYNSGDGSVTALVATSLFFVATFALMDRRISRGARQGKGSSSESP
ncbi:MAG: hypothetical protein GXP47_15380 [Acidobacteria bacterium]|nr:hypothetical protein [Acidobacteriota bacterium]